MQRHALDDLRRWAKNERRKPLVIRGARQVGKTTLVRLFAEEAFEHLVSLDFERDPQLASLFESKDPMTILSLLEIQQEADIVPGRTLLFLDEIQVSPQVLAALRYFYEEMPELHVIAAGSLLELALDQPTFSVPVGRIEYLHLGPMQFAEFLLATDRPKLAEFLHTYSLTGPLPEALHKQLSQAMKQFLVVGGMPEAVLAFAASGARQAEPVKHSILTTFQDDFGKYGDSDARLIRKVFTKLPQLVGQRLKYVLLDRQERAKDLSAALDLLCLARVGHRVQHSAGNGVPLAAQTDERKFKLLFLDIGLMATATGLSLFDLETAEDLLMIHQGALCEQFIGQHLLYSGAPWETPVLHFWARDKSGSNAEVDYVISRGREVVPIEVKAGKTGTLKSLHLFLREKNRHLGLRFNTDLPSLLDATTSISTGENKPFRLLSLPLYMVGETRRLLGEAADQ